ncbi:MAG: hypothetical protein HC903_22555 [Methylacidiphilales bacterium]|nr:hypothetical protein [Candidatus Methylacidiphilales bacterium]NJR16918.1 hypothetical protein [Calothrix sp. CSU_2_0]
MMRSALAGANTWLSGGKLPKQAGKGIIFVQDIASLNLRSPSSLPIFSASSIVKY